MKQFTVQEIKDAINKAPKFIQEEMASGEDTAVVIAQIGQKYGLHVDKIGMLAELNRNMLLGLVGPEEFLKELIAAGVSDKDAREIMAEISQKIFVPLREKMRSETGNVKPQNVTPSVAPRPTQVPMPSYVYAKPKQSSPLSSPEASQGTAQYFHLENKIAPPPPRPPAPSLQQPASRLLEDHEEPHIELNKNSVPPNLPDAMILTEVRPSPIIPPTTPEATRGTERVEPLKPVAPARPYSSDPYREPIDEK